MIVKYKDWKRTEYPKLDIKFPLHCYMASETLREFRCRHGIADYEKTWVILKEY